VIPLAITIADAHTIKLLRQFIALPNIQKPIIVRKYDSIKPTFFFIFLTSLFFGMFIVCQKTNE